MRSGGIEAESVESCFQRWGQQGRVVAVGRGDPTPMGMPWPSTASERSVPCFPLSTEDRPATCPPQGALTMQPSTHMRVGPGAHHLVVCSQCGALQGGEDACGDPIVPAPPDGGGRAGVVCDPVVRGAQD